MGVRLPSDDEPVVLVQGDCLDMLRQLPDGCVDAVITDPPYGISFQSAWRTESERFGVIVGDGEPAVRWLSRAASVIARSGCVVCFCRWDTAETFKRQSRTPG
jgi:DNA modification methylase